MDSRAGVIRARPRQSQSESLSDTSWSCDYQDVLCQDVLDRVEGAVRLRGQMFRTQRAGCETANLWSDWQAGDPKIGYKKMAIDALRLYREGMATATILLTIKDVTAGTPRVD